MKEEVLTFQKKTNIMQSYKCFNTKKDPSSPKAIIPLQSFNKESVSLFSHFVMPETMLSPIKTYGSKKRISLLAYDTIIGIEPLSIGTPDGNRDCYTEYIDNDTNDNEEYEEERELVEILEGKRKKESYLIKSTYLKHQRQPKCDIIQEIDEEKYNLRNKQYINRFGNDNNQQSNRYILKRFKRQLKNPNISNKGNNKDESIKLDGNNSNNDKESHNTLNSNFQTESSSMRSPSTNGSNVLPKVLNTDNTNNNSYINTLPIIKHNSNVAQEKNKRATYRNETFPNRQNIERRDNLLSAPILQIKNNPLLINNKKFPFGFNERLISCNTEANEVRNWMLSKKNNKRIVNMSQRRKEATAPIKVFASIKPFMNYN